MGLGAPSIGPLSAYFVGLLSVFVLGAFAFAISNKEMRKAVLIPCFTASSHALAIAHFVFERGEDV